MDFLKKNIIAVLIITVLFSSLIFFSSCEKEADNPVNPYDNVNYGSGSDGDIPPDPNTITGLHKNIFSVKCAVPNCHDGNFEPDFRTVQSTYSTLVYHPVVKNTNDEKFSYRVIPYDTAMSWLHERVTTDDSTLGRMPLYSTPLSNEEVQHINTWIMNGAPDVNGNLPLPPNEMPNVTLYLAYDSTLTIRIDTNRKDNISINPFIVNANSWVNILVFVSDDSTAVEDMQYNTLKMSLDADDFSSAISYTANFLQDGFYKMWRIEFNTSAYSPGTTVYFRYYVNDGDHADNSEFPNDDDPPYYKTIYAFYVQ